MSALDMHAPAPIWGRRLRQINAVTRLELRKLLRGRRLIGVSLISLAPFLVLLLTHLVPEGKITAEATPANLTRIFGGLFGIWVLRISVFFTCATLAIQLLRNEVLEKTLHYMLLAPVHRGVMVTGKFLAATIASSVVCGVSAVATYLALFAWLGRPGFVRFMLEGPGLTHLLAYVGVVLLGCIGYGAVFALLGLLFKNPIVPALLLFGWEGILFLMPPALKLGSVMFYLHSLIPVSSPNGPFAVLAQPPPAIVSIAGLICFAALVLGLAAWRATRMEILYSTD